MSFRRLRKIIEDPQIIQRLEKHHIHTCKDFLCMTKLDLLYALGINEQKCRMLIETVSHACASDEKTVSELHKEKSNRPSGGFFPTSLPILDAALQGGLLLGNITEIAGPPSVGKTQFCLMLSALAPVSTKYGGLDGSVIYVDTESAFCAERLREIAMNRIPEVYENADGQLHLMVNVHVFQATTSKALKEILYKIEWEIIQKKVKLVVIDSIASLLRKEYCSTSERSQILLEMSSILKDIAKKFDIVVFVTNQITSHYKNTFSYKHNETKDSMTAARKVGEDENISSSVVPALGITWAHCVNTRLLAQFLGPGQCQLTVAKSPLAPIVTVNYSVTKSGISLTDKIVTTRNVNPYMQTVHTKSDFLYLQKQFEF